jgi:transglutaminase-like putative cysteine protease
MRVSGLHRTCYRYSRPVFLEPHVIRLRPRDDGAQCLIAHSLEISPVPAGRSECLDRDGNVVLHAWFDGLADVLEVRSAFTVETLRANPFDFLAARGDALLPPGYTAPAAMAPYLEPPPEPVREFAAGLAAETGGRTLDFLAALNHALHDGFRYELRDLGPAHPPEQTLADRTGSCRDFAVLFAAAARSMGIAARFVSGYYHGGETPRHMHAWAEVYLEGGGWRGYDPAQGLAVSTGHVAVAAAPSPDLAAPIAGSIRGAAESVMDYTLQIHPTNPESRTPNP